MRCREGYNFPIINTASCYRCGGLLLRNETVFCSSCEEENAIKRREV
jgi:uncharacterized Zn finger protein (UPF0148 family)